MERLVQAASGRTDDLVTVLLSADAGLRRGEVIGLEWNDLDVKRGELTVQRAVYRGVVDTPKGGKTRTIPMTSRHRAALQATSASRRPAGPRRSHGREHPLGHGAALAEGGPPRRHAHEAG